MMSEVFARRLFRQAGVSVLAGLLLSSAVMAEDDASNAGDGDVAVSIDVSPEVCPEPALGNVPTVVGGEPETGIVDEGDGGPDVMIDPIEYDFVGIEPDEGTGEDPGAGAPGDGEVVSCDDCPAFPDVTLDPIEWEGAVPVEDGIADPGSEVPPEVLYATGGAPTDEVIATGGGLAARSLEGGADRRTPIWPMQSRRDD